MSANNLQARRGSDIYAQHLLSKKRGFPLWIPGSKNTLPKQYQRKGIHIGDVGIITAAGGFSFLFNIFRPAEYPLGFNPRTLPEGFAPLDPPLDESDICNFFELKPKSHLASTFVKNGINETSSCVQLRVLL